MVYRSDHPHPLRIPSQSTEDGEASADRTMENETVFAGETLQNVEDNTPDYIHREELPHHTSEAASFAAPQAMGSATSTEGTP